MAPAPGAHGGADEILCRHLFSPTAPVDDWGRGAGPEQGAASILVGIAAVESIQRNLPVNVLDLVPVVWSGKRKAGADGKVPSVDSTVDVANATWTNTIGAPELITVWQEPEFDAKQRAFYYVRVIEIPTPRWTAYDAKKFGIKPLPGTRWFPPSAPTPRLFGTLQRCRSQALAAKSISARCAQGGGRFTRRIPLQPAQPLSSVARITGTTGTVAS